MLQLGEDITAAAAVEVLGKDEQLPVKLNTSGQEADDFIGCDQAILISFMDAKFDEWMKTDGLNENDTKEDTVAFRCRLLHPECSAVIYVNVSGFQTCTTLY